VSNRRKQKKLEIIVVKQKKIKTMAIEGAYVSSEQLSEFKDKVLRLSKTLVECHETLTRQLSILGNTWQDTKYEQFVEEFKSSKEKILLIGEQYEQWANGYLTNHIEKAIDYEVS
jgi:hypothetical protein